MKSNCTLNWTLSIALVAVSCATPGRIEPQAQPSPSHQSPADPELETPANDGWLHENEPTHATALSAEQPRGAPARPVIGGLSETAPDLEQKAADEAPPPMTSHAPTLQPSPRPKKSPRTVRGRSLEGERAEAPRRSTPTALPRAATQDSVARALDESVTIGSGSGAPPPSAAKSQRYAAADEYEASEYEASARRAPLPERCCIAPPPVSPPVWQPEFNTEAYDAVSENGFVSTQVSPLSTFSVDVDTASYSNVRRFLSEGQRPPAGAVRVEELVNYFSYAYPEPTSGRPFALYTEVGPAPWAPEHQLLHIGLQGKKIAPSEVGPKNLVFLIDVSGSMNAPNKLPLLKRSFASLIDTLSGEDSVAMVVYAGASGVVLSPTRAAHKATIHAALERLSAGGSTNGAAGIGLAYQLAQQAFVPGGVNRVVLATDGDFNVGTTNQSELVRLIEDKRQQGVFLTVLGFGMGNYKDSTLEKLADKGNGNYAYIDSEREARKVLVEEGGSTLVTIAKDVKLQIEFNPQWVGAYRLIGYENRRLANEDFNDDKKDAGEVGAGHTVTALYELLTPEQARRQLSVDGLKYQVPTESQASSGELATLKLRYKAPESQNSSLLRYAVTRRSPELEQTSAEFRFSAAVASFGMLLSGSAYKGTASYAQVSELAARASSHDPGGYRGEFLSLVSQASRL